MAHDKIKAAARSASRRPASLRRRPARGDQGVPGGQEQRSGQRDAGGSRSAMTTWLDLHLDEILLGGGPAGRRIEIDAGELRLWMADFKVDVPARFSASPPGTRTDKGTIGVHAKGGSCWRTARRRPRSDRD